MLKRHLDINHMPGSENQEVKIRLAPKAQINARPNFYFLKNSAV